MADKYMGRYVMKFRDIEGNPRRLYLPNKTEVNRELAGFKRNLPWVHVEVKKVTFPKNLKGYQIMPRFRGKGY